MLRILGHGTRPCDGLTRREAMCVGGLSLFGGMTLPALLKGHRNRSNPLAAVLRAIVKPNRSSC